MKSHDIKIIIIGDVSTGKTSFMKRWITGKFDDEYKITIKYEYNYKVINVNNIIYRVQIWDIGGQDRTHSCLSKIFVKGCHAVFIFSDITVNKTLQNTIIWKNLLNDLPNEFNYPVILFQNKIDLVRENELNETQFQFKKFAEDNNFDLFYRISAKDNKGIDNAMNEIITHIINKILKLNETINKKIVDKNSESIHLKNQSFEIDKNNIISNGNQNPDKNNNDNEYKKNKCC
jgi:small GTP-binding protein